MEEQISLKIEKAKTWFVLAQIIGIFAGFMFASSGIYWTNMLNTLEYSTDVNNKALELTLNANNLTLDYIKSLKDLSGQLNSFAQSQINLFKTFFNLGLTLSIFSLTIWGYGKYKIHRIK